MQNSYVKTLILLKLISRMTTPPSPSEFPLADIPRRLDELPVRYVRHNRAWQAATCEVTLHDSSVPFPRAVRVRANARPPPPANTVVWRVTLVCPGTYNCTPRDAARVAKSKSARCNGRLRVEVVRTASNAFAARFAFHGEARRQFCDATGERAHVVAAQAVGGAPARRRRERARASGRGARGRRACTLAAATELSAPQARACGKRWRGR